jgi:hypothetical protein
LGPRNLGIIHSETPETPETACPNSLVKGKEGRISKFGKVGFDPETLAILEGILDEAWVSIQAQRNGNTTRAALADRVLNLAVKEERNPARLLLARPVLPVAEEFLHSRAS